MPQPLPPLFTSTFARPAFLRALPSSVPARSQARLAPPRTLSFARLLALACLVFFTGVLARAHEPLEGTLSVRAGDEALEVVATLSPAFAGRLLDPDSPPALNADSFPTHRPALLAAAARVCTLADTAGRPLTPTRVVVSIDAHGEVRFLCLYPADARPARLDVPALQTLPPGYFCLVADETTSPPRKHLLVKDNSACALGLAASSAVTAP